MTTGPVEPVLTSEGAVETVAVDPPSPLRSAARHWITVLLLAVLGAALGVFYAYSRPDITTAEARVGVGSGSLAAYQVAGFAQASSDLASNYARYVDLEQFQPALQKGLGAADTATIQSVAASPVPDANVIRIEVTSTSADVASRASQLVAEQLINQVKNTGSSATPASVLKQVVTLNNQIAQAQAVYDRAQTAYAKLRNAPGGSPVSSVVSPSAAPATAADKAANQAAAAQAAADAQVATLTIQRDALKQKYQTLVNEPAAQSGLRLVSDGHATSHSQNAAIQRWGLAGLVLGLLVGIVQATARDRRTLRRRAEALVADGRVGAAPAAGVRGARPLATGTPDPHTP